MGDARSLGDSIYNTVPRCQAISSCSLEARACSGLLGAHEPYPSLDTVSSGVLSAVVVEGFLRAS